MKKYEILLKLPNERVATVRESFDSYIAAISTLREFTSELKRRGYKTSAKPKPNKVMNFVGVNGEEVRLYCRFTHQDIDVRRATRELDLEEALTQ